MIHGAFDITLSGNLVVTRAVGPWNRECVIDFHRAYSELAVDLMGHRWGDLVLLIGESILVPDAARILGQQMPLTARNGLTDVALVTRQSSVRSTTIKQLSDLYNQSGINFCFFDEEVDAIRWLVDQGLTFDLYEVGKLLATDIHYDNLVYSISKEHSG